MTAVVPEGGAWPTRHQALLLSAALRRGDDARSAWRAWRASVDLEGRLDGGSYRLLPLVYHNLVRQGETDAALGRLKGVYRLTWYKNQLLFRALGGVLRGLAADGLPALVLKGASLVQLYYQDLGLRPMDDFDVLVPETCLPAALKVLTRGGWTPKLVQLDKLTPAHCALRPSCGFQAGGGRELDLHWHVLMECCQPGSDDDFWAGAVPLEIAGVPTRTLNPSDHLLHTCLHGLAPNVVPPVRWIADAVLLLRHAEAHIDWERLCAQAERRGLGLLLHGALDYLRQAQNAPVPAEVVARLRRLPATPQQRAEYRARTQPVGLLGALPVGWSLFLRHRPPRGPLGGLARLAAFPHYMQVTQGFDHVGQVFAWAFARALAVGLAALTRRRPEGFSLAAAAASHTPIK